MSVWHYTSFFWADKLNLGCVWLPSVVDAWTVDVNVGAATDNNDTATAA